MLNFDQCKGQTFNIGGGVECSFSLLELTNLCEKVTGEKIVIHKVAETRSADIPLYITDNSKFSALSGWKPRKSPEDIVRDIFEWIKQNKEILKTILE
jgi:CDP-paratose 2-epimerase